MGELISIVVPAFNAAKYINFTIRSVLAQSYQNWELIVVIDGATDNTESIVKMYLSDQRIRYTVKPNSGVSDTRNVGIELSKGKYILFLDADDILSANFLEDRIKFLENNNEYGFCGSVLYKIDEDNNIIQEPECPRLNDSSPVDDILLYKNKVTTSPSNFLFRKSIIEKNGIRFSRDLSSTADRFFLLQLLRVTKMKSLDSAELLYRIHSNSMSALMSPALFFDNKLFFEKICYDRLIPEPIRREVIVKHYYILAGMARRTKNYRYFIYYLVMILLTDPAVLFSRP
jgi:teichuronic acid biosynthesis glycosyltransferase TuaG